jgi:long-chain fatty acid transport protein
MLSRVLILLLLAPSAQASIFDVYGMGARGLAMGGSLTTLARDHTATFYNPAALARSKQAVLGGSFVLTLPSLDVRPTRSNEEYEPVLPESFSGITLGWVFPLGGIFESRFAFGVSVYIPTINLVRAEALDPQLPQFYLYQNLPDHLVILAGVAYEPVEWLSLGVGVQILADVFGHAYLEVDIINGNFDAIDMRIELRPKVAATAGLHLKPIDGLEFGVTYRQEIGLEFGLPAEVDAGGGISLGLSVGGTVLYSPHQINVGVSYHFSEIALTASAELDVALWSMAPDPSPRIEVDFGGVILDAFGLDTALDVRTGATPLDLNFRDTLTPRVGLEWEPLEWLRVRGGYYYRPTPAPYATGAYNYLDNDVHAFSLGLGFLFPDPANDERAISLDIGNQLAVLPRRSVRKENALDPVGDFEHDGMTYSLNVTVTHTF